MSQEIKETIRLLGLQDYVNCKRMNVIEITLDSDNIIEKLLNYRNFEYRFLI